MKTGPRISAHRGKTYRFETVYDADQQTVTQTVWENNVQIGHWTGAVELPNNMAYISINTNRTITGWLDDIVLESISFSIPVEIDIKPGTYPNPINLGSKGVTPVAILSTVDFDATLVDESTVELSGATVAIRGKSRYLAYEADVNGDELLDLVCHVETQQFRPDEFVEGYAFLTGATLDGREFHGYDEVTIVPRK